MVRKEEWTVNYHKMDGFVPEKIINLLLTVLLNPNGVREINSLTKKHNFYLIV